METAFVGVLSAIPRILDPAVGATQLLLHCISTAFTAGCPGVSTLGRDQHSLRSRNSQGSRTRPELSTYSRLTSNTVGDVICPLLASSLRKVPQG